MLAGRFTPLSKPRLRGAIHHAAFYVALGAGSMLVASTSSRLEAMVATVYAVCLAALFGISALYHCPDWPSATRNRLRRLDHAAIFLMIAGTYTPIGVLTLGEKGISLIACIWLGAVAGVLKTILWAGSPKTLNAALYVGLGWLGIAQLPEVSLRTGPMLIGLLLAGGVIYSIGALVYVSRRPDPVPLTFGYHEVFHSLVVLAAICHFVAIVQVVRMF